VYAHACYKKLNQIKLNYLVFAGTGSRDRIQIIWQNTKMYYPRKQLAGKSLVGGQGGLGAKGGVRGRQICNIPGKKNFAPPKNDRRYLIKCTFFSFFIPPFYL
jgi:hypothetical protein